MKRTHGVLVVLLLGGCQARHEHAERAPVSNAALAAAPVPSAPARAAAAAAAGGNIYVAGLPSIPPQSEWETRIRNGDDPIVVAMAGNVKVVPFYQPSPGVWEYIVQENGVFSLPIIGDTLPVARETQTHLPGGRQVTTTSVQVTRPSVGELTDVAVIPWALPEPGHTIETDLEIYMAGEVGLTGLTVDKAVHGRIGGAPGLLVTAGGKVAGTHCQALLWKIYLPAFKRVISYSVYSTVPADLRTAGEMMLKWFTVEPDGSPSR
jgi:hypothetical protein